MKVKILLIEGKQSGYPSCAPGLEKKGFLVERVPNGKVALEHLTRYSPQIILINAASLRSTGRRICQSLRAHSSDIPICLVLEPGSDMGEKNSDKIIADVILFHPFTVQKLLNRIRPYLPAEQKNILKVGPLQLDVDQHWVRCGQRQSRLTPRLVVLLRALMEHPGEVVDRNLLFKQVWDTTYVADTRTLDVHVSWLRKAIEEDPRHPRYLKTVRGFGYRLDLEV
jgi:DNA-binding response OmpR family regulator